MKRTGIIGIFLALGLFLLGTGKVWASEGIVELGSTDETGASCFALSVFSDGRFEVLATCRGLVVPYSAEQTRYFMWARDEKGKVFRVGEVKNGKISQSVQQRFVSLEVTVEGASQPRKPGEIVVASGQVKEIAFPGAVTTLSPVVTPTPTKTLPLSSGDDEVETKGTLTRFLAVVGRVVGIGFLVLLVGVVLMTIVTRRKEKI